MRHKDIVAQQYANHSCLFTHMHISTLLYCELVSFPALLLQLLACPPASTQHPEITAFPSGRQAGRQAVEGTATDMLCLLSNERRNVTAGPAAGRSQPSIHTCGISSVYQTAGRQLCSQFLSRSHRLSTSAVLSLPRSPPLHLYSTVCVYF